MGELRFSGLSSGIDTAALVQQLMNVESQRLARYQVSQMGYEEQTTALDELRAKISGLKSVASSLSDIDDMQIYSANSSDKDILNASASSEAGTGSHSVAIDQLATAETWIQETSTFNYKTDYVGGGDFIYTYNNQQRIITAVENETTLEDFVNLINNDENNPGVTASLLYQGGEYHLMLNGQETGEDYQISIDESSREVWKPDPTQENSTFTDTDENASLTTKITELDQFTGSLGTSDIITIIGKNHAGSSLPDTTLTITENTTLGHLVDAINEHYDGTATARLENGQIVLTDNTCGPSGLEISLSFTQDTAPEADAELLLPTMAVSILGEATLESLDSITSSSFIETQNANNAKVKIDGFPSGASNEVQTLSVSGGTPGPGSQFRLTLDGQTTNLIDYNADDVAIKAALEGLAGVEIGDVAVSGSLATGDVTITFQGNLAGTDITKITVSDDSTMNGATVSVAETAKGNDGWIHRNSNTITDALEGISLSLQDVTETDAPVTVTVTRNTGTINKKIQAMVSAYNELISDLKTKTEYDGEAKAMGILSRDMAASFLKTQARSPFASIAKGFVDSIDKFVQADDLGITIDGAGMLEFDSEIFNDAIGENYKAVLELLGATKSGNSSSTVVQFYSASDKYTTAGIYHVKVTVDASNQITSAQIKLSTDTEYRDATSWDGNMISFDNSFDENGNTTNPEHSLQLTVDLAEGTYGTDENPVVIRVKQGIFGTLEDTLSTLIKTDGQFDISTEAIEEKISRVEDKIEKEETRLQKAEDRLTQKYARLEKTLTTLQQQMSAVSAMMGS